MTNPNNTSNNLSMDRPNAARMYDYFLGGSHNFIVDRKAADQVLNIYPDTALIARVNRAFLQRVVKYLLRQGINQFLDIGSGIPTAGNVHEIVHATKPDARVVYIDNDPIAVAQSKQILANNPHADIIDADARQPEAILSHSITTSLIDFQKPIAILLVSLLHFIADDAEVKKIISTLRNATVSGSYLVLSHITKENIPEEIAKQAEQIYKNSSTPICYRTQVEMQALFDGFELIEPGVVIPPQWHSENPDDLGLDKLDRIALYGGVGRKP
ncbi:MAG: SAM-dependent methyltransferase [Chloroflexota bacterium]